MKANELRLGNWVQADGVVCEVVRLDRKGCITVEVEEEGSISPFFTECSGDEAKGIPLTENHLCGFSMLFGTDPQEPNALKVYKNGAFELLKFEDGRFLFYSSGKGFFTDIKFVHQLQNLYFALTGEELEVKL